jgi:acylphosphatase
MFIEENLMIRFYLKISGRVQGVGYRYFAENAARESEVTGWVRNMPDGRVEAEAQGEMHELKDFFSQLRKGPVLSRVKDIEKFEVPVYVEDELFEIRY